MLAFILMLIKVPPTEYARKLMNAKSTVAVSFLVCGFMMAFSLHKYDEVWNYNLFSSYTMLIAASFSSMAMSYSMINLLDDKKIPGHVFVINTFLIALSSFGLMETALGDNEFLRNLTLAVNIILFVSQSIWYIILFDKTYKKTIKALETYYDEDEEHKVKWIKFCYIIAMLTDLFLLVYMLLPNGFMKIYIAWYILFMLYFTANLISFLGSHKMVLDAFAHKALSGQNLFPSRPQKAKKEDGEANIQAREKEFRKLEKNIKKWVEEKRYREYDKTREEIAEELGTSREMLQLYFTVVLKADFRSWRTELRIGDAKKMLLENRDTSTNIIGEMCGFSDRSNFHSQFTKTVGCSPKKWRETDGHPETV
ncbi:MAG: helix-turn-helix domain-containing protein [Candidatus Cryptobacteroides sp.]